jgi:hypothetical protein
MEREDNTVWCEGCGVEVIWGPTIVDKRYYCCPECADGLQCDCGVRMEMEDDRRIGASGGSNAPGEDC